MRADLSRGHRPDDKRNQRYRRVLTQQGRLWLDSDVAASVDATDRLIRHLAKDVGCPAGSPDTGYLASPGPAFAWFDSLDHVTGLPDAADPFRAFRDYAVKYMERFPSLYLDARAATAPLEIQGRRTFTVAATGKLRLWMRRAPGASAVAMTVNGTNVPAPAPIAGAFGFDAYDYDLAAAGVVGQYDTIELGFAAAGASNEAWVGFIEGFNQSGLNPLFWVTEGRYYVDGLEVEFLPEADTSTFLEGYAPLPAGTRIVAYLEAWERLITHVEDPGLRDSALGGLDTTVRTRPMGQVKIALVPANVLALDDLVIRIVNAFDNVNFGSGNLDVAAAASPPNPDPCAIPIEGGYNADENRLYRFEVQVGGNLGVATIKWSRNNGSELYQATVTDPAEGLVSLQATPGTAPPMRLLENDIVELLNEVIDVGDAQRATIDLSPASVRPSVRRVGRLCFVKSTNDDGVFQLFDLATQAKIDFTAAGAPPQPTRLRKWDGVITSTAAPSVHVIEDGLELTLSGSDFRAGDYWQFEARRLGTNAATPPVIERHGPERLLTPLALFEIEPAATSPIELQHWFDDRFRPLCELRADDIYYDGDKSGTEADTVQEAIDELYILVEKGGGCCDFTLTPSANQLADDTARIQDLVDQIEGRGKICLERGVYNVFGTISIEQKHVTIEGCPEAIIIASGDGPVFLLGEKASLALENLIVRYDGSSAIILVKQRSSAQEIPTNPVGVTITAASLVHVGAGAVIQDEAVALPVFSLNTDQPIPFQGMATDNLVRVHARDAILAGDAGVLLDRDASVVLEGTLLSASRVGVSMSGGYTPRITFVASRVACDWTGARRIDIAATATEDLPAVITRSFETQGILVPESVAVSALNLYGEAHRTQLAGDAGVLIQTGEVRFSECAVTGWTSFAYWSFQARLDAFDTSFTSTDTTCVHVQMPWLVTLARCSFDGLYGAALAVLTDLKEPSNLPFDARIRITECAFASPMVGGVFIGPMLFDVEKGQPNAVQTFRTVDIAVCDNAFVVRGSTDRPGFGVTVALVEGGNETGRTSVRIERNDITGRGVTAVAVRGTTSRIADNRVDMVALGVAEQGKLQHATIVLYEPVASVIEANTMKVAPGAGVEAIGIALLSPEFKPVPDVVIRENNVSKRLSNGLFFPLIVAGPQEPVFRDVTIIDNDFAGGNVEIVHVEHLVVRGNRFRCERVRIAGGVGSRHGTVEHNSVTVGDGLGLLLLLNLSGTWRVAHNLSGDLHVLPRVFIPLVFETGAFTTYPLLAYDWLTRTTPIPSEQLTTLYLRAFRGITGASAPPEAVYLPPPPAPTPEAIMTYGLALDIGQIFDDLADDLAAAAIRNEGVYKVHVADNVTTRVLAVGYLPVKSVFEVEPATPNRESWVQVLGNQVGVMLIVNTYEHLVVGHNLAAELAPALGGTTGIVTIHNHNA